MANKTTVGVFRTRAEAENAIRDLRAAGYSDNQIGMVAKNAEGKTVKTDGAGDTSNAAEGALLGAAAGGVGAAAVGAGIMAGVIPVIGPILALGPLAVTLINAASGAAVVGLAGALVGMGFPKEDAEYYQSEVASGRYLVTVDGSQPAVDARQIYVRHGGYDRSTANSR
jgi:hypothetical protein